ncbi:MAG: hypothetical protein OXU36_21850 [Candidatus Poribacteria bacterium]|nr:hypothetical protein [Candidatus Poribacteria bacterium]
MNAVWHVIRIKIRINGIHALGHEPGMKSVWTSESTVSMPVGIDRGMKPVPASPGYECLESESTV